MSSRSTPTELTPDYELVCEASKAATGANIHRLPNLLTVYYGFCELGEPQRAAAAADELRAFIRSVRATRPNTFVESREQQ